MADYLDLGVCVQFSGGFIPKVDGNPDFEAFKEWLAAGGVPDMPPPPTIEQRAAALLQAVEQRLNAAARAKGYDDIRSAALRAGYPGPFHAEGVAFATWMDGCYADCYQLLAQVKAGEIPEPTESELLAMLPVLELP